MANEIKVNLSVTVKKGNVDWQSKPTSFLLDAAVGTGPYVGAMLVTTDGVDIDLSSMSDPGLMLIQNLDDTNYITLGVYNTDQSEFYPLMEIPPASGPWPFYVSRHVNEEYAGTGTSLTAEQNTLRLKAANAACKAVVNAFER